MRIYIWAIPAKYNIKCDGSARNSEDVPDTAASRMDIPQYLWLQGPAAFGFGHNLL